MLTTTAVINQCYGGYRLSDRAARELARRKGVTLEREGKGNNSFLYVKGDKRAIESIVPRNDADLVEIVRTMGKAADGECANLRVVDVKVEVDLDTHDGYERIGHAYAEGR